MKDRSHYEAMAELFQPIRLMWWSCCEDFSGC